MEITWEQLKHLKKNIKSFIKFWKLHFLCADSFDCLRAHTSDQPPYILLGDVPDLNPLLKGGEGEERGKKYSSLSRNSSAVLGNSWDAACPSTPAITILYKKFISIMEKQKTQEVGYFLNGFSLMAKISTKHLQGFFTLHLMSLVWIGHCIIFC